ncbi:hypothetical protein ENSA7_44010 [Enhygromyxa salina]|uniref:Uncharacterized protein n=2 Tax=Enhygromyxa salina TaxID=215803 RepID=A0A2S9YKT5_9BACT|nr:hypothetical protein ENSA7_44010 [Enhygromyxa salina]
MLALAPADGAVHELDAAGLDPVALQLGLRARVGDELDQWRISIEAGQDGRYELALTGPGHANTERRTVELNGQTETDRSRELASILAVIIESAEANEPNEPSEPDLADRSQPPAASPERPRGFMLIEGHVGLGPPRAIDPGLGVGLGAGAWLLGEHLQPRVRVRWSHGWAGEIDVHQADAGLGLAAGAPVARGQLWLGILAMPVIKWTHAEQLKSATAWAGGGELGALAQLRLGHLVMGVRTGVETTFPALRARGTQDVLRWGHVRWLLTLEIGLTIPKKSELPR